MGATATRVERGPEVRSADQRAQLNESAGDCPVQDPAAHPAQLAHFPLGHCASAVHQHAVPEAPHVPELDATSSQLPTEQEYCVVQSGMPGLASWQCMPS